MASSPRGNGPELEQWAGLEARLDRSALDVEELKDALTAARERRDGLVVQAVDEGYQLRWVATAAHLSTSSVERILGRPAA